MLAIPVSRLFGAWRVAVPNVEGITKRGLLPPLRQAIFSEAVREQGGGGGGQTCGAALGLGADRVEIHEPALEQRPSHLLQRRRHAPVQFDLVVEAAKCPSNSDLNRWRWKPEAKLSNDAFVEIWHRRANRMKAKPCFGGNISQYKREILRIKCLALNYSE